MDSSYIEKMQSSMQLQMWIFQVAKTYQEKGHNEHEVFT